MNKKKDNLGKKADSKEVNKIEIKKDSSFKKKKKQKKI